MDSTCPDTPFQNQRVWSSSKLSRVRPHTSASVSREEPYKSNIFIHVPADRLMDPTKRVKGASFLEHLCRVKRVPEWSGDPA